MTVKMTNGFTVVNGKKYQYGDILTSTEEHENRLVLQGMAEVVYDEKEMFEIAEKLSDEPKQEVKAEPLKEEEKEEEKQVVELSKKMTFDFLKAIALDEGLKEEDLVDSKGKNITKQALIDMINLRRQQEQEDTGTLEKLDLGDGADGVV